LSNAIAVSIVPGEVRLLVARANGAVKPLHQLSAELPPGAVRAGLQAPNVPDIDAIAAPLAALAGEADALEGRNGMVAVLIPDAVVRLALVPLEGSEPSRAEGDAMARWALGDLLPIEPAEARIDWAVLGANGADAAPGWLLAVGAATAVVREYEAAVEAVGWDPGRVVPLTMALAIGADELEPDDDPGAARIVLSGIGGQAACLVEAGGVPRFHRAWRGTQPDLELELPAVQRYVDTRLDLSIVDAVVAGPEDWRQRAASHCAALGWRVRERSGWSAHLGAVQP
jgi:Tfp pilus assembly PilM family ATPase